MCGLWVELSRAKPGNPVACSVINSRRSLAAPEKDLGRSGRYPLRLRAASLRTFPFFYFPDPFSIQKCREA